MVEGVCAVVMVNESGQPCLKELLFWYFPFLCIYETKCSVTQILAVEFVQVFPVKNPLKLLQQPYLFLISML